MSVEKIKRVIGVDPGLSITGFGILDYKGGQIRTVAFGTIKPPVKESLANRLEYLNSHMTELLEKFEPNDFAIEDTFFSQNVKSALLLGQARGVLLLAAASKGIPTMDYAPRKVKQSVVGNGAADKKQVQYMVQQILEMKEPPKPLDVSDALAIGLCHINQNKYI
ncbi:MAG: crossover junction endodeoxyribonuclease RuvC [Candidatus Marinimicrobia bacterium]|nr:crossover junction endodeoxyribonuclease RuvC [Candidatus Neomarinimicrobiota bacterium]